MRNKYEVGNKLAAMPRLLRCFVLVFTHGIHLKPPHPFLLTQILPVFFMLAKSARRGGMIKSRRDLIMLAGVTQNEVLGL